MLFVLVPLAIIDSGAIAGLKYTMATSLHCNVGDEDQKKFVENSNGHTSCLVKSPTYLSPLAYTSVALPSRLSLTQPPLFEKEIVNEVQRCIFGGGGAYLYLLPSTSTKTPSPNFCESDGCIRFRIVLAWRSYLVDVPVARIAGTIRMGFGTLSFFPIICPVSFI